MDKQEVGIVSTPEIPLDHSKSERPEEIVPENFQVIFEYFIGK
jgi:hypothetical protein